MNGVGVPTSSLPCSMFLLNKGFRFQGALCSSLASCERLQEPP